MERPGHSFGRIEGEDMPPEEEQRLIEESKDRDALSLWFGLSYASFLTLPRVLMEAMPARWQGKMAALLREYEQAFPNQPDIGTRVQITKNRKLIKTPKWLINYRHPDREMIESLKGGRWGLIR